MIRNKSWETSTSKVIKKVRETTLYIISCLDATYCKYELSYTNKQTFNVKFPDTQYAFLILKPEQTNE